MQAQDPSGEGVNLLLLRRLCQICIYSHKQHSGALLWTFNLASWWEQADSGLHRSVVSEWNGHPDPSTFSESMKTYRIDSNAFVPGRNYLNLCFQNQTTLNSENLKPVNNPHTWQPILGMSCIPSLYPWSHLAFTWLILHFCCSLNSSVSQSFCFCFHVLFPVNVRIMPFL